MTDKKLQAKHFTWILLDERGSTVRWGRVCTFAGVLILGNLFAQAILNVTLQVPFRLGIILAVLSAQLAYLATVVELQRQYLKAGKSVFRFDLTYLFVSTLLAALFIASLVAEIGASRRGMQRNNEIKAQLEKLIDGGSVYLSGQAGKRISCVITRPDFSDAELIDLIEFSRGSDLGVSEITMLVLDVTAVTDNGLQSLSACPKLETIALPPIALSDATLEKLAACSKLRYLTLDQKKLTETQLNQLVEKLAKTKINGVSQHERQAIKRK